MTRKDISPWDFCQCRCRAFTSPSTSQNTEALHKVHSPSWFGNINPIPFQKSHPIKRAFVADNGVSLGPTHPCPITVHTEPCSTSVLKALTSIFATNTKICTRECFSAPHGNKPSQHQPLSTPSYSKNHPQLVFGSRIGLTLKRYPFSGLIHSAGAVTR